MPSATMAIWPPVSARSSSCWATRPDSVVVPAPKSVDSTEKAELPMVAVTTQQHDPGEDDGAPAAHHEASEPVHHAATRSCELRAKVPSHRTHLVNVALSIAIAACPSVRASGAARWLRW